MPLTRKGHRDLACNTRASTQCELLDFASRNEASPVTDFPTITSPQ